MESEKVKKTTTSNSLEKQEPPIRSVYSLKNKKRIREIEKVEDCFIIDFHPYKSMKTSSLSRFVDQDNEAPDITVVAEHGKVACRDFPHSRHQCLQYPFSRTPHEHHCKLCHCYVCDIAAPCTEWSDHCNAIHLRFNSWWYLRRTTRGQDSDSDSDSDYFA